MTDEMTLTQVVDNLQLAQLVIEWVPYDTIRPNKYNPNKMAWTERQILKQSLLEDGWTQPIVTLQDRTIVDGEQRWTTAGLDLTPKEIQDIIDKMEKRKADGYPESDSIITRLKTSKERLETAIASGMRGTIAAITGGLVPITRVDFGDDAHKMISTIRHNRARGAHQINAMADITGDLMRLGLDLDDLEKRLGMEDEEIRRFMQAAEGQAKALLEQGLSSQFDMAKQITHIAEVTEDDALVGEIMRSAEANKAAKEYQMALAGAKLQAEKQTKAKIESLESEQGRSLTQDEKEKIAAAVVSESDMPVKPAPPRMKKFYVMITAAEMDTVESVFGESWATGLVLICEMALADKKFLNAFTKALAERTE